MKSKYIFIHDTEVHPGLRVYFLNIGMSAADIRKNEIISFVANANREIYFAKYSMEVLDFLERLAMQLYPDQSFSEAKETFYKRNRRDVTLNEIYDSIKGHFQSIQRNKPNVFER